MRIQLALPLLLLLLPLGSVRAQEYDLMDFAELQTDPEYLAPFSLGKRFTMYHYLSFTSIRGHYDNNGKYAPLPQGETQNSVDLNIYASYSISPYVDISLQSGVQRNYRSKDGQTASSLNLTDSSLYLWGSVLETQQHYLSAYFSLKLPTGKYQNADAAKLGTDLSGNGSYEHGYGFYYIWYLKAMKIYANADYNLPLETTVDGVRTLYGNYFNYRLMTVYPNQDGFAGMLELSGSTQGRTRYDGQLDNASKSNSLHLSPGLRYSTDTAYYSLSYERSLAGKNIVAYDSFTLLGTFWF